MTKLKTRSSANKRYRRTRNQKVIYKRPCGAHFLEKKSQKQKRHIQTAGVVCRSDLKTIKGMLLFY